jgi:hypothetical protein
MALAVPLRACRPCFPGARQGYCLRHALNKLPDKLVGLAAPVHQGLRSKFHTLLYRCRQRKSLRVMALGQRLRRFADHVTATVGEEHGERVRSWFEDKKAGWYGGARRPQDAGDEHRAGSSAQRHRPEVVRHEGTISRWEPSDISDRPGAPVQPEPLPATRQECGSVRGGSRGRSRPDIGLDAQPANPHLRGLSACLCASKPLNSVECGEK